MKFELAVMVALLTACTAQASPSSDRAAAQFLAVHNDHDQAAARALWGEKAAGVESHMAWFREQVGHCHGVEPMWVKGELEGRYVLECERGQVEVHLRVDAETGVVRRSHFGARGVEPSAEVRQAVDQLVAVANGESTRMPALAERLELAEVEAELAEISAYGTCQVDRVHLSSRRGARYVLECTKGSATLTMDLSGEGAVRRFFVDDGAKDAWRRGEA